MEALICVVKVAVLFIGDRHSVMVEEKILPVLQYCLAFIGVLVKFTVSIFTTPARKKNYGQ